MCVKVGGGRADGLRYVVVAELGALLIIDLVVCSVLLKEVEGREAVEVDGGREEAVVEDGNAPVVENRLANVEAASNTEVLRRTVVFGFVGFDAILLSPLPSRLLVALVLSSLLLSVVLLLEVLKVGALSLPSRLDCIT